MIYVFAVFAVYYLARTAALEDGPFGICSAIRERIDPNGTQDTWLRRGVNCPICIACYMSLIITAMLYVQLDAIVLWLGLAGAASALYLFVGR